MSEVPPTPPPPSSQAPLPSVPPDPRSQVNGPALALMVLAGLYILYVIFRILTSMLGMTGAAMGGDKFGFLASGVGLVISVVFNIGFAGIIFYGAMQMKGLKNYNMALAASIAAMIPCGCCCVAGIPIGIWSLIVLLKPEVKAAFPKP